MNKKTSLKDLKDITRTMEKEKLANRVNYDYYTEVEKDLRNYLQEEIQIKHSIRYEDFYILEELKDYIIEQCNGNYVTNGGVLKSIYDQYTLEEFMCHNWRLFLIATEYFDMDIDTFSADRLLMDDLGEADHICRVYVLYSIIDDVLADIEPDFDAAHENK